MEIPKTINELFDVCEKVKALNVTPLAINYRQQWTMDLWVDVIPHLIDNDLPINSTKGYNNILDSESGMYKSLNLVREIVKRGYAEKDLFNYDWQQFKNDMSEGKIEMAIWNSDFIYKNKRNISSFSVVSRSNTFFKISVCLLCDALRNTELPTRNTIWYPSIT